jgi:hypothetical protein
VVQLDGHGDLGGGGEDGCDGELPVAPEALTQCLGEFETAQPIGRRLPRPGVGGYQLGSGQVQVASCQNHMSETSVRVNGRGTITEMAGWMSSEAVNWVFTAFFSLKSPDVPPAQGGVTPHSYPQTMVNPQ